MWNSWITSFEFFSEYVKLLKQMVLKCAAFGCHTGYDKISSDHEGNEKVSAFYFRSTTRTSGTTETTRTSGKMD